MPPSIIDRLARDFPEIKFVQSDTFSWSASEQIIHYSLESDDDLARLLHELAHASLQHTDYDHDIELINIELQAWQYTVDQLGPRYGVFLKMNDSVVQDSLDSYRDWLYQRSCCVNCSAVGFEKSKLQYYCPVCQQLWRVNQAKTCQLRRYKTP